MDLPKRARLPLLGFGAPVLLTALLLLADVLGMLSPLQGWLYDQAVRLIPARGEAPGVLLVELPADSDYSPAQWEALSAALFKHGARRIGLLTVPPQLEKKAPSGPGQWGGVIDAPLGQAPLVRWGQLAAPLLDDGVARRYAPDAAQPALTLEWIAAERAVAGAEPLRINFIASYRLPQVSAERVLAGDLVEALVAGRVVLIGQTPPAGSPGLVTPLLAAEGPMSQSHYRARVVSTLLANNGIISLPRWGDALLIVLVAVATLMLYQLVPSTVLLLTTSITLIAYLAVGWVALLLFRLQLPLVALLLAQLLGLWLVLRKRRRHELRTLINLRQGLESTIRERLIPELFAHAEQPWQRLIVLINHTLSLERTILLERIEGDHRLREIQAFNCSLDDISERRRDYQRDPYKSAIAAARAIPLRRPYLAGGREGERQYMVPLVYAGEVLGFWALATASDKPAREEQAFLALISDFAEQIGELLFHWQSWQQERDLERQAWRRMLSLEASPQIAHSLRQSLEVYDRRLLTLEELLNALTTSVVVYDLFGQLTFANHSSEVLLRQAGVALYNETALDLLVKLADQPLEQAREHLRRVIVEQRTAELPAQGLDAMGHYALRVRPLFGEQLQGVFQVKGLVLEFHDLSSVQHLAQLKDGLIEAFQGKLRNDLSAISMASQLAAGSQLFRGGRKRANEIIESKLGSIVHALDRLGSELEGLKRLDRAHVVPINLRTQCEVMIEHLQHDFPDLQLQLSGSTVASLCLAEAATLRQLLEAALRLLIDDARPGTPLLGELQETQSKNRLILVLRLYNRGFGLPSEQLDGFLHGERQLESPVLVRLRRGCEELAEIGGSLELDSEVNRGIEVTFRLRGLNFSE